MISTLAIVLRSGSRLRGSFVLLSHSALGLAVGTPESAARVAKVVRMLEPDTTVQDDLRGGRPPWLLGFNHPVRMQPVRDMACEVLIVGAGITGALMAQHLTSRGHQVCVIDRERGRRQQRGRGLGNGGRLPIPGRSSSA